MTKPIPEEIREYIDYNPETGECGWKKKTSPTAKAGDSAGSTNATGYIHVGFRGTDYLAHRVAWYLHHGEDPGDKQVDHINGNRSDNRISNLRLVVNQENSHNRDCLGIYYRKDRLKWRAKITLDGKQKHLGTWDCPLMAGLAYKDAKRQLHPTAVRGL